MSNLGENISCQVCPLDGVELLRRLHGSVCRKLDPSAAFSAWTKQLFASLEEIKHAREYEVYRTGAEGFLFDFIWYDSVAHAIVLATEIEWGPEESKCEAVSYDFEKLMHVKAPLKLMVYRTGDSVESSERIRTKLESRLARFASHLPGEEYLLLEFSKPWDRASCYRFRVAETSGGRVKNPQFLALKDIDFALSWKGNQSQGPGQV